MNENKVKVWLARDMNGSLYLSQIKPKKEKFDWVIENPEYANSYVKIDANNFPSIKWEDDEPTEAYITLAETQEQPTPKQEIDWEQRRYEIVKSIAAAIYSRPTVKTVLLNVNQIISAADAIINELKKQSDEL